MIGGLQDRVTRPAALAFCHVNASMWGNPPTRGQLESQYTAFGGASAAQKLIVRIQSAKK